MEHAACCILGCVWPKPCEFYFLTRSGSRQKTGVAQEGAGGSGEQLHRRHRRRNDPHHQLDLRRWTCAPGEAPRLTACAGDCTHREEEDVDEERLVATAAAALERQRIESLPFEERQQALQLYRRRGQGRTRRATRGSGNGTPRRQQQRRRRRRRGALDRWRRQAASPCPRTCHRPGARRSPALTPHLPWRYR